VVSLARDASLNRWSIDSIALFADCHSFAL